MWRILTSVLMAAAVVIVPMRVTAQPSEDPLYGPGLELLEFEDQSPDDHGLAWVIHEPVRADDHWAVSVYNASAETVSDIRVTIEYLVDGEWYLSGLDNHEMFILPATLEPESMGFAVGEWLGHAPEDWTDVRVDVVSVEQGPSQLVSSLAINDLQQNQDGGYSGTVINDSDYSLRDVGLFFACIDDSGRIVDEFYNGIDLRKMDPGDSEPFDFSDANGECPPETEVIVTAAGVRRD